MFKKLLTSSGMHRKVCLGRHFRRWLTSTEHPIPPEVRSNTLPVATKTFNIPEGIMGQPTCLTHPHMIQCGMLTCRISQKEYKFRRDCFMEKIVEDVPNVHKTHLVVIPAAAKQYMSDKIPYVFRQNSDFFYLTGCLEPGAVLVLIKEQYSTAYKSLLFVVEKDSHAELWEGPRTGLANSETLFAVDEAMPVDTLQSFLAKNMTSKSLALWYHREEPVNASVDQIVKSLVKSEPTSLFADPKKIFHGMRLIKSPSEVELMKESCRIGSEAMNMAMACTRPGVTEHKISAVLEYASRTGGAEHAAFPPVVAGGPRATHIHYVANSQLLYAHEMLLVDQGCQYWMYNSDISRTWPVSGKFDPYQRVLYEIVLQTQKRLLELLERRETLDALFSHMCRELGAALRDAGVIPRSVDGNDLIVRAYRLCPHHVSHYLGMDVHDTPTVRRNVPLRPGMVVTVEPGLYIRADDDSVPPEFRGKGVRVEDDVLIADTDSIVLTAAAHKEIADIEAAVGTQTV